MRRREFVMVGPNGTHVVSPRSAIPAENFGG
jgi:hypothetical protein